MTITMMDFEETVQAFASALITVSRGIRALEHDGRAVGDMVQIARELIEDLSPEELTTVVLVLCARGDDWEPTAPIPAETAEKIDTFLANPETGVLRELPARRRKGGDDAGL